MVTLASAPFKYHRPETVEEASRLLGQYGGMAKLLAGGHSLVPLMKLRLASPEAVIDLGRIKGLSGIKSSSDGLSIGATTTYYQLESSKDVQAKAPVLAEAASQVADTQVRNFGTIGGALAHADPAGDIPAVVLALGATLVTKTQRGGREIAADRFFQDFMTTALRPNEVLTEIRIPALPARTGTAYVKLANKASHYAVVGIAAVVTLDASGICTAARVGVTGAGPFAVRARRTERLLVGKQLTPANIRTAAKRAGAEIGESFNSDVHASSEYREAMTQVFAERAIAEAAGRAN